MNITNEKFEIVKNLCERINEHSDHRAVIKLMGGIKINYISISIYIENKVKYIILDNKINTVIHALTNYMYNLNWNIRKQKCIA
jgi:hypothetical protein